ncbi:MAG: hypothetical protein V9G20_29935 [Candidatus Promineifilaceae bacterium]|jgi:hypothetical protein
MTVTAKAAVLALTALIAFSGAITSAHADEARGKSQIENSDDDTSADIGRKKPKFQTKFFSED